MECFFVDLLHHILIILGRLRFLFVALSLLFLYKVSKFEIVATINHYQIFIIELCRDFRGILVF